MIAHVLVNFLFAKMNHLAWIWFVAPHIVRLIPGKSIDCPTLSTPHCQADCLNIPNDIICEAVNDEELLGLLNQYANTSSNPLRLTIRRSPLLQLSHQLFEPVIAYLWDLRLESDTIVNEIPSGTFQRMKNLRSLDLTGNQIAHLHAGDFVGLTNLMGLKLERNPLIDMASGLFDVLPSLQCLDLDENSLTCDCKLLWMKKWAMEHPKLWEDNKEVYAEAKEDCDGDIPDCEYPPIMKDRNVTEIPADICEDFLSDLDCLELQTAHCRTHCDNWTPVQIQCKNVEFRELHGLLVRYSRVVDRVLRLEISHSKNLVLNGSLWLPVRDQLIHLNLNHGRYVLTSGSFAGLSKLLYLNLDDSELGSIPKGTFSSLSSLKGLSLDDTNAEHIDEAAFEPLESTLTCLRLDDEDDGLCECEMKWLPKWITNHSSLFGDRVLMYEYNEKLKVYCDGYGGDCTRKPREDLC